MLFRSSYYYLNSDPATYYQQRSGAHAWHTAASGTAGDPITFIQAMTLDANGNLLVGTTTAVSKLTVESSAFTAASIASTQAAQYLRLANSGGEVRIGSLGDAMLFTTGSASTERARIDSSGNMGIGTSSPGAKLEVYNSSVNGAFVPNTLSTWRVAQIRNDQSGTSGSAAGIAFVGKSDTQPAGIVAINGNTTGGVVGLGFLTVSGNTTSESMRLDSSGNLGLGVTPSAWRTGSGERAFQVGNRAALFCDSGTSTDVLNNVFVSTSSQFTYLATAAASRYQQNAGAHSWYTAASGTEIGRAHV